MGALAIFKELVDWILIIPKLVKLNATQRQETRDAVGSVADELNRGLELVAIRIEGAKIIASAKQRNARNELVTYLNHDVWKNELSKAFSEFKICRGLREKRDHFKQLFHPAKAAVRRENRTKVTALFNQLEYDERMIIDEVGSLLTKLREDALQDVSAFLESADEAIQQVHRRQKRVKRLARRIHDEL